MGIAKTVHLKFLFIYIYLCPTQTTEIGTLLLLLDGVWA